jgi:uncharacterized damage-inducible protein DinB
MLERALTNQLTFIHFAARKNVADVSHEESLRAPAGGGNSMNWILGHVVYSRSAIARALGGDVLLPKEQAQVYERGAAALTGESAVLPFSELLALYDRYQEDHLARLARIDGAALAREVPGLFRPEVPEPVGVLLSSLVFHEAYHVGQLGLVRRSIGKPGAIA